MAETADLIKKLQIKPGTRLWLINAPDDFAGVLRAASEITIVKAGAPCTAVLAFAQSPAEASAHTDKALRVLPADGLLWLAYRKGAAAKASGLSRDTGWSALTAAGWTPVRSISIDDVWTGLRFRPVALVGKS